MAWMDKNRRRELDSYDKGIVKIRPEPCLGESGRERLSGIKSEPLVLESLCLDVGL
jgi:hypothetical protein